MGVHLLELGLDRADADVMPEARAAEVYLSTAAMHLK